MVIEAGSQMGAVSVQGAPSGSLSYSEQAGLTVDNPHLVGGVTIGIPQSPLGTFGSLSHRQAIELENHAITTAYNGALNQGRLPNEEVAVDFRMGLEGFQARVWDERNYVAGAGEFIRNRLTAADELTAGQNMYVRARERLRQFNGRFRVISDLDGTISEVTDPPAVLIEYFPGSNKAEELLRMERRRNFPEVHASFWRPTLLNRPEMFSIVADAEQVKIRDGVKEFLDSMEAGDFTILSANFEPFVRGVLKKAGYDEAKVTVLSVTANSVVPTDKGTVLLHEAKNNHERPIIYIGDGSSDLPAMQGGAEKMVAVYFALDDSAFARELEAAGLTHFTYRDFRDISRVLELIDPYSHAA